MNVWFDALCIKHERFDTVVSGIAAGHLYQQEVVPFDQLGVDEGGREHDELWQ